MLNDKAIPAVKDGGAFTAVRGFKGNPQREIRFTETWVTQCNERDLLDELRQHAEQGALTLRVADTISPERAGEAHRAWLRGTRGRMVIDFLEQLGAMQRPLIS